MAKQDDYNAGFEHGRHNNAMWGHSAEYRHGYYQGQQERRYWDEESVFDEDGGDCAVNAKSSEKQSNRDFDYDALIPNRYKSDDKLWAKKPEIEPVEGEIMKDTGED